jgi:hypothetical protein
MPKEGLAQEVLVQETMPRESPWEVPMLGM